MDGIINVLKPVGISSYQVVDRLKKITGEKKVGHTGTLDPLAAGVLPLCFGRATKVAGFITDFNKSYRAEITFGTVTDTQDLSGKILKREEVSVSKLEIEKLLEKFKGKISQIPPMHSAVKYKGKRLYKLAREGIEVERKPRKVTIYSLKLIDYYPPNRALIDIVCSKGTYIRALCYDIGVKSGYGAVMSFLVRLRSGNFDLQNAVTIEELEEAAQRCTLNEYILPTDYSLRHLDRVEINERSLKFAINGNSLGVHNLTSFSGKLEEGQLIRVYFKDEFIAIGRIQKNEKERCIKIQRLFYKRM